MGRIHDLVLLHGIEGARALAASKHERQCVEIAAELMSDETDSMGISHAGFAMTSLPHKEIHEPVWRRQGGKVTLLVESGRQRDAELIGVPYGSKARMILLYLQTQAVRSGNREVELGPSMKAWMTAMGMTTGGATYRIVTEQARRISACRLTFFYDDEHREIREKGSFVDTEISMATVRDTAQPLLWRETVELNERFYQSLRDHPVPVLEAALRQIGHRSMTLDVYVWLAYRLHALQKPTPLTWLSVHSQFGAGFKMVRQLKPKFIEALELALAVYPEARVEADADGVILYPSRPPVAKRMVALPGGKG